MAIAEDASEPAVVTNTTGNGTLTTASFSPPAGSLVLVLTGIGYDLNETGLDTISSSPSVTWTDAISAVYDLSYTGTAHVSYHYYASAPGSITVSSAQASVNGGGRLLCVKVLTGVDPADFIGNTATRLITTGGVQSFSQAITTTAAGSVVYGVIDNVQNDAAHVGHDANSTVITNFADTPNGITLLAFKQTSPTGTPGSITLGAKVSPAEDLAGALAMVEILALAGPNPGTDTGTLTDTATVKVTAPTDTGTFADTASVVVQATDAGAFTEAASAGELVPVSDAGIFTDTASVIVGVNIVVSDSGAFTDSAFVSQGAVGDDAGTFTDTATVVVHGSDSGILFDSVRLLDDGYLVAERVKVIPADNRVVRIEGENRAMIATAISDGGLIPSGSYIIPAEPPPDDEEDIITTDGTVIDDTGWLL